MIKLKKKHVAACVLCNVLWGTLPVYWNLLAGVDSVLILCCRIFFSLFLMTLLLAALGKFRLFTETLKNRKMMKCLIPAGLLITVNWGTYIWAVNSGHVLDSSLGYFMEPLAVFLLGVILFREKCSRLQAAALLFAAVGVAVSVIAYGHFPYISLALAVSFSLYGAVKKRANAEALASICVETLVLAPFAILFALLFRREGLSALTGGDMLLLAGTGLITGIPMTLYAISVNNLPFIVVGFLQYISPTITLCYGLAVGEKMTASRLVSFVCIIIGLIIFSADMLRTVKKSKAAKAKMNITE